MDDDTAISYEAAVPGSRVLTSAGKEIGTLEHVLEVPSLDVFDGIVIHTKAGLRFVDADQVGRITASYIRLEIDDEQAARLPAPTGRPSTTWTRWPTAARRCTTGWAGCSAARTGPRRSKPPGQK